MAPSLLFVGPLIMAFWFIFGVGAGYQKLINEPEAKPSHGAVRTVTTEGPHNTHEAKPPHGVVRAITTEGPGLVLGEFVGPVEMLPDGAQRWHDGHGRTYVTRAPIVLEVRQ